MARITVEEVYRGEKCGVMSGSKTISIKMVKALRNSLLKLSESIAESNFR